MAGGRESLISYELTGNLIAERPMDYPQEFSVQARARIEAERLKASRDLEKYRSQPETRPQRRHTSGPYGKLWTEYEEDLHEYILRTFLAFALQACELGSHGTWAVDRIRAESLSKCRPLNTSSIRTNRCISSSSPATHAFAPEPPEVGQLRRVDPILGNDHRQRSRTFIISQRPNPNRRVTEPEWSPRVTVRGYRRDSSRRRRLRPSAREKPPR